MKDNYSRNVELICPICGGVSFSYDENNLNTIYTCINCKNNFTKDEILEANSENIDINLTEIKDSVIKDIEKDFKKILKKFK